MWFWVIGFVVFFCFCFILRILIPYHWLSFRASALYKRIPGPKYYPVIGNYPEVYIQYHEVLPMVLRNTKKYGSIWKLLVIGLSEVFFMDPDDVELLLHNKHFLTKGLDYEIIRPWLGTGLLTSTGDKWMKHRKILTPAFHFKILESYIPIFNKHSETLVEKMEALMNHEYVDINELVTLCTLDIVCETAMGVTINVQRGENNDYVKAVKRMGEIFHERQMCFWLYHPWSFAISPLGREQARLVKRLHTFTQSVIQEKKSGLRNRKLGTGDVVTGRTKKYRTFLDTLLEVSEESGLSDTDIREEVDTFMFEGHDTTSAAICWALLLIGGHQDVQDRVVEELKEIFGDSNRDPDFEDLQKMKYMEQVIKEALRLYPSVPGYSRQLNVELKIRDFVIPIGANVAIIPYVIHRNPDIFPDPETFNPDHFHPDRVQGRHPYAYLPFSAGPRNCIGQRFAILEEKVILSRVLRTFRLTSLDKREDVGVLMQLILRPSCNIRLKIEPRV